MYGIAVHIVPMHTILTTRIFERQAKEAKVSDVEMVEIEAIIANDPRAGNVIEGTGGARKLRIAKRGGGKSGGYRTIHYYAGDDVPVFLLGVFGKSDKANLSKKEKNQLAQILPQLADAYRIK